MLKFLHHLIRVQLQTPTSTGAVEEESGGVPRRNKTPAMSQAVGTLPVVLWLVFVVEWMFCGCGWNSPGFLICGCCVDLIVVVVVDLF